MCGGWSGCRCSGTASGTCVSGSRAGRPSFFSIATARSRRSWRTTPRPSSRTRCGARSRHSPATARSIISGRDLAALGELVGLDCRFYAGSHGFEIGGPDGWHEAVEQGGEALPQRDRAEAELRHELADVPGHAVERKLFAVAIHYRRAAPACRAPGGAAGRLSRRDVSLAERQQWPRGMPKAAPARRGAR